MKKNNKHVSVYKSNTRNRKIVPNSEENAFFQRDQVETLRAWKISQKLVLYPAPGLVQDIKRE